MTVESRRRVRLFSPLLLGFSYSDLEPFDLSLHLVHIKQSESLTLMSQRMRGTPRIVMQLRQFLTYGVIARVCEYDSPK